MSDRDEIEVVVPDIEAWDSEKEEFINVKGGTIRMKHSLLSISKWEMTWKKPFLKPGYVMTPEETLDYYKCMTITQNVNPDIYRFIPEKEKIRINKYIETPMSAYMPKDRQKKGGARKTFVSENIYYWMTAANIPQAYEKWHLSRLLNLLEIAADENDPKRSKKMTPGEIYRQNTDLNQLRRKALGTRG